MATKDETDTEIMHQTEENSAADASFEGARMKMLRNVMTKTIKSYTANLKLIKPLKNVSSAHLELLHSKTISQLQTNIQCELEQMYKEENLEVLLNSLDKLIAENPPASSTEKWRPSGNIQEDVRSEEAILKREKLKVLEKTLSDLEAQNKLLVDRVQKREQHLLRTRDKMVAIAEDFEQVVEKESEAIKQNQEKTKD